MLMVTQGMQPAPAPVTAWEALQGPGLQPSWGLHCPLAYVWCVGGQRPASLVQNGALNILCTRSEGAMGVCVCQILDSSGAALAGPPVQMGMQPTLGDNLEGTGRPEVQGLHYRLHGSFPLLSDIRRTNAGASWPPSPSQWYPHSSFPASNWTKLTHWAMSTPTAK